MNPKITPEIQAALEQNPVGPIRLEGHPDAAPVFLVRLDDIANLQDLVDGRIREKLAEADADIAEGRVNEWNPDDIKSRGRLRFGDPSNP